MADAGVALDIVCYVFAGLYGALFVWSVIRLLLLQRAYTQWTQQKLFHLISCGIGGARAAFFGVTPGWSVAYFYGMMSEDVDSRWIYVLDELPALLLISLYSVQLLAWAKSFHAFRQTPEEYRRRVLPSVVLLNIGIYALQILLWISFVSVGASISSPLTLVSALTHATAFMAIAIAIMHFGFAHQQQFKLVPMSLSVRLRRMHELMVIAVTCTVCFAVRACVMTSVVILAASSPNQFNEQASFGEVAAVIIFFSALEVVPWLLVLRHQRTVTRMPGSSTRGSMAGLMQRAPTGLLRSSSFRRRLLSQSAMSPTAPLAGSGRGYGSSAASPATPSAVAFSSSAGTSASSPLSSTRLPTKESSSASVGSSSIRGSVSEIGLDDVPGFTSTRGRGGGSNAGDAFSHALPTLFAPKLVYDAEDSGSGSGGSSEVSSASPSAPPTPPGPLPLHRVDGAASLSAANGRGSARSRSSAGSDAVDGSFASASMWLPGSVLRLFGRVGAQGTVLTPADSSPSDALLAVESIGLLESPPSSARRYPANVPGRPPLTPTMSDGARSPRVLPAAATAAAGTDSARGAASSSARGGAGPSPSRSSSGSSRVSTADGVAATASGRGKKKKPTGRSVELSTISAAGEGPTG